MVGSTIVVLTDLDVVGRVLLVRTAFNGIVFFFLVVVLVVVLDKVGVNAVDVDKADHDATVKKDLGEGVG